MGFSRLGADAVDVATRWACRDIHQRVREAVRSFPSNGQVGAVIQQLNPILNGWCTYFLVGCSNRIFHKVDWFVRSELQLWLRRKHQCPTSLLSLVNFLL